MSDARSVRARRDVYRRRRLRALGGVAAIALLAGVVVGAGSGEPGAAPEETESAYCREPGEAGLLRAAGQGVMVRMEARATAELRRQARAGEIGGVILFPPSDIEGERLAAQIERLQSEAESGGHPRLLVAIDQEGGIVERLPALAPQLSPFTIAENDDRGDARLEGRATGFQLRELGIDVDLAPVFDVPADAEHWMIPRAFGSSPAQVSRLAVAFARGLQREGVAATAKHFPGLGSSPLNTDFAPSTVDAREAELRAGIEPFAAAIAAGVRLVMVSLAEYPALGAEEPAALSPAIITGELRERLGFGGVVITDDLLAEAVAASRGPKQAARSASAAGADVLLFAARNVRGIARHLVAGAAPGSGVEERLRSSCERIERLKAELATGEPLSGG